MLGSEVHPEDEIRHAQRLIGSQEEDGLLKMVSKLSDWNFDVDYRDPKDSGNTLLHYSCLVCGKGGAREGGRGGGKGCVCMFVCLFCLCSMVI